MKTLWFAILLCLMLLNCKQERPAVHLFAAASLAPLVPKLNELAKREGLLLRVNLGASSTIAQQILRGARCDLVVVADEEWMNELSKNGHVVANSRRDFLSNRLVVVAQLNENSLHAPVENLGSLARIAIADPSHVPAGKYAKEALEKMGIWTSLGRRALLAQDVRTVLFLVENGQAPYGIVYESDALSSHKVRVVAKFDEHFHRPIRYPLARCRTAGEKAKVLENFLLSSPIREIFGAYGFRVFG